MTIVITNNDNGKYRGTERGGWSEREKVRVKGREERDDDGCRGVHRRVRERGRDAKGDEEKGQGPVEVEKG